MELQKYSNFTDISLYIKEVNAYPMLTSDEERALAVQYYEKKDLVAARALVTANLRFVVKIAYEYVRYGHNLLDLIQEGNLGLMMAVKKFDPYKNYKLISYAVWWIRAYIHNYIVSNYSLVKIGTTQNQRKLFYNLSKLKKEASAYGLPSDDTAVIIADRLDVSPIEVDEMELRLSARDFSLDYTDPHSDKQLIDSLQDYRPSHSEVMEESMEALNNRKMIESAMASLTENEKTVIENRILTEEPLTLHEVGEKLGITRERVRQIECNALQKLKKVIKLH